MKKTGSAIESTLLSDGEKNMMKCNVAKQIQPINF